LLEPRNDRPEKWLLREACKGLLPPAIMNRRKMKFSEGAGSSGVMEDIAGRNISSGEYEARREVEPGITIRSPEELYYYRIWREAVEPHIPAGLVGRTLDVNAAGCNMRESS
jgi:asparagine synthase (glutamine-hydrolysing)